MGGEGVVNKDGDGTKNDDIRSKCKQIGCGTFIMKSQVCRTCQAHEAGQCGTHFPSSILVQEQVRTKRARAGVPLLKPTSGAGMWLAVPALIRHALRLTRRTASRGIRGRCNTKSGRRRFPGHASADPHRDGSPHKVRSLDGGRLLPPGRRCLRA
jgi:hypothetical protein